MNNKYVYYDEGYCVYREIDEKYLESAEKFKKYFGHLDIGEIQIYKLTTYKNFITTLETKENEKNT